MPWAFAGMSPGQSGQEAGICFLTCRLGRGRSLSPGPPPGILPVQLGAQGGWLLRAPSSSVRAQHAVDRKGQTLCPRLPGHAGQNLAWDLAPFPP